ncbi:MAG TPA: S4 domain-containing protein, partial [Solirubrobacteraceae bacterium]|nr:S4 domain-containing protein [Solirubrobacteraceae bacterium]
MRLAKHLAHAGAASRRAAERLIVEGRVSVDGSPVTDPARDVGPRSQVTLDGRSLSAPAQRAVYLLHKPTGVLSTARDTHGRPTVVEL